MNNIEKELFNQFFLDYLEEEVLTPSLKNKGFLEVAPSKLGIPGTLGIVKTVNKDLISENLNEKEEENNTRSHNYFELNFKTKCKEGLKFRFDLSFVLYVKSFPKFSNLNLMSDQKNLNKKLRQKRAEIKKEVLMRYKEVSYEEKEVLTIDLLRDYMKKTYNLQNNVGLNLVIEKILVLLKSNSINKDKDKDIVEEVIDIEEMNSESESDSNQFLINKLLFLDNNLTEEDYNKTIEILSENDAKLYKEFFNEIIPNYTFTPIKIEIDNIEVEVAPLINEKSEVNRSLNQQLTKKIEEEILNQISLRGFNININKKLNLINFINEEKYSNFINQRNDLNNILIYYPKIKLIRSDENFRIIVMGCDYIKNENNKAVVLFDDRLFNTNLKLYFNNEDLGIFYYSNNKNEKEHYKYQNTKPIYCQSNYIATWFENSEFLEINTTWNPKYYLPRNKNTGIHNKDDSNDEDKKKDEKLFSYSTWFNNDEIDFSIIEEIPKKYKEWINNIDLSKETKESKGFNEDLKKWEKEIENITLGINLLKLSNSYLSNPEISPIINSWTFLNETFSLIDQKYTQWRLFQLCFVLSLLPSIVLKNKKVIKFVEKNTEYKSEYLYKVIQEADENVNLLFFNAGGGKTEAFLSIVIFTMFFERLTGINHGLTAILKYPLRLLLTQQTNRVLKAICAAEKVRRKRKINFEESIFDTSFSLGVWVGSTSTPNQIDKDIKSKVLEVMNGKEDVLKFGDFDLLWEDNLLKEIINSDDELNITFYLENLNKNGSSEWHSNEVQDLNDYYSENKESYKKIDSCPFCSNSNITTRIIKKTLFHFCLNKNCEWNENSQFKGLPFYIVDQNIYERNPTVIISTTDKLSSMGYLNKGTSLLDKDNMPNNRKVLGIFGIAPYYDTESKIYTWKKNAKNNSCIDLFQCGRKVIKFPQWIIQDETHLLIESLGSFSAIFERNFTHTILEIQKKLPEYVMSNSLPQIIASTATMASPEKQLLPIYDKKNICLFPSTGYRLYENFYSKPVEKTNGIVKSTDEYEKYEITRIYNGYILNEIVYFKTANNIALLHHYKIKQLFDYGITQKEFINELKNKYYKNLAKNLFINNFDFEGYIKENVLYNKILINYTGSKNTNEKLKKWENDICFLDGMFKDLITTENQNSITSDVNIIELSKILEKIDRESNNFNNNSLKSIFATQSISHGVDSAQFNAMIFHGIPEFINEYIQASARIGRTNVGYVTVLPLKNNKDQLIMNNFENFHRFIDRPVLANTIDFKTKTIVEKTLSSLFISWYINVYKLSIKSLEKITFNDLVSNKQIVFAEFFEFISKVLGLSKNFILSIQEIKLDEETESLKELLENQWGNLMTSLRDTEKNAKIVIGEKNENKK